MQLILRVNDSRVPWLSLILTLSPRHPAGVLSVPGVLHGPDTAEHHDQPGPAERLR